MTDTHALVERIARFVEGWNGDTRDGDTFLIAEEIRAQFASAPPVGETSALVEKLERGTLWERMERGNADCLGKRRDGEPMFIILGRDPDGAHVVRYWAQRRRDAGDPDHAAKAFAVAELMAGYS